MTPPQPDRRSRVFDAWIQRNAVQVLAQLLIVVLLLGGMGVVVNRLTPILAPLMVSMLLAYFLDPLIDWFEARRVSRTAAIVLIGGAMLGVTIEFLVVVLPTFVSAIAGALEEAPQQFATQFQALLERVGDYGISEEQLTESLSQLSGHAQSALSSVGTALFGLASSLLNAVLIPVFTFYFLRDFDRIKVLPMRLVPPRYHDRMLERVRSMDEVVGHWLRGQIQVGMVLAVLYAIGLGALGLKLGVVIGLVAGILNVVPYFGLFVGLLLALVMALTQGTTYLIGVPIVFAVVQAMEQYIITPKLIGDKVGLSPVMVMAVLLVGGSAFGFFGLVLAIPVFAAARVLWPDMLELYESTPWWRGDAGASAMVDEGDDAPHTPEAPVASALRDEDGESARNDENDAEEEA